MSFAASAGDRLSRLALGATFAWLGYGAASDPGGRVVSAANLGLPNPEAAVRFNGAAMAVGGAALALGILPRAAALGLVASLVPTTIAGHAFWKESDPTARAMHRTQALKNLGLAGGLLAVAARR
ncbi:DoxX family membrane protein [Intrasporangium calvum]|uniref:DoxX family protein n=1 Tax=Intrasporangium calvum (strain ATCC 23552 / DSM 43043 / JCM 3097 / NBRC 12989 / NCIMB 10167 / NRRL B-3866 / 7 KIP) TaxID=710696 RepID=E6SF75_INTC7|nr:DoxX family membrane protein [Intrasporangium calvum]ADU49889.1 DoxX family protein [Intrasporangium calvum DSM 43043]AXG14730.1 DoxX family membrane protein [Intrasporangium calvum]